ncbi:MAG: glucose-1-phosphate cytidylyltransferase [Pyrinomonadaceae bacterium]|nr:glucose-1-phosphate cytidylyltransferase [Pyrinomonadaceae bacterium]MBP6213368.1 glucose-1-phosphate cytidylyltransferase [Pyrinomonadaceae bacterium]
MKVVILAGGLGTRLAEETEIKPKPMVEIGGRPVLWHIMKIFSHYGLNDFYIALGYKGEIIKRFFYDYQSLSGDLLINLADGTINIRERECEDWRVNLIETGQNSMTGGRVKRLEPYLSGETFIVTYGDGVSSVDIGQLIDFHRSHGKIATVTAVHPPARYGELLINPDSTAGFSEKPQTHEGWINGGFIVFEPKVFEYLSGDNSILEIDALERLANEGQLVAYKHNDFWQCMDTLRDKRQLEAEWNSGNPPWKVW